MVSCPSYASTVGTQEEFTWTSPVPAEATSTLAWPASFTTANVKTKLRDGYWIEAFPFRTSPLKSEGPLGPELIGYGLGEKTEDGKIQASEVKMYLNPFSQIKRQSKLSNEWDSITIKSFDYPVALTYGKFRKGEKLNDIIICHDYGASMDNLNEAGGIVSYLKNPGDRTRGDWEQRYIGKSPAMHRLKTGYFTQKKHLEIMALPIMVKSGDRTTPAPVIIYQPTKWDDNDENKAPSGWVEIKYHAVHTAKRDRLFLGDLGRIQRNHAQDRARMLV